jgi:predicted transposase/invertase (TIGR01784 family)
MTNENAVLEFNNKNEREYMASERRRITSPDEVFPEYFLLIVDRFKRWSSESQPSLLEDGRVATEFDEVNEVAKTPIEEWMTYLKDGAIREDTTVPGLQEARRKLEYMSMSDEERREYRDYMVSVHAAKDAIETAKEEGRAEGEQTKAIDAARKMKAKGFATEDIAEITGLTAEEIDRL